MLRRTILLASACLAALASASLSWAQDATAEAALADVRKAVVASSGYDDGAVALKSGPHQIMVTLVNSKLLDAGRAARVNEAHRVASAVAKSIAGKTSFAGVDVIHIDYVRRAPGADHADTVDAMDFRKDPAGEFKYHVS